ncbi:UDP binding domain-containing protein [Endothiovibrio diazotrophicus]
MSDYAELVMKGRAAAVWGMGYLGSTNLIQLTSLGIDCLVSDYDRDRLENLKSEGELLYKRSVVPIALDFAGSNGWRGGRIEVVEDYDGMFAGDPLVHFICVSNQDAGAPSTRDLTRALAAFGRLAGSAPAQPPLMIIETTFMPGTLHKVILPTLAEVGVEVGRDLLVTVAPRRDREVNPIAYKPAAYPRMVGGVDAASAESAASILELFGHRSLAFAGAEEAEMARVAELALAQVRQAAINQMAQAFPGTDVRAAIELVEGAGEGRGRAPSLGFGGYDQPLACQYLLSGAHYPEMLTIASEAHHAELAMVPLVSDRLKKAGVTRVAILGLAVEENTGQVVNSPATRLAVYLRRNGVEVTVCEPFLAADQVERITGASALGLAEALAAADGVVLYSAHAHFKHLGRERLAEALRDMKLVLDCCGQWVPYGLAGEGIPYVPLGGKEWMG